MSVVKFNAGCILVVKYTFVFLKVEVKKSKKGRVKEHFSYEKC